MRALLLLILAGCSPACARSRVPMGDYRGIAVRVTPPLPQWLAGYAGAEVCSGIRGDVRLIRWHVVPGASFTVNGDAVIGYADGLDIYLAESGAGSVWLARHEALHTLGYKHPHADSLVFRVRCRATWPTPSDTL